MEIELYSGETEELIEIGKKLTDKYELTIAEDSKYAIGINLIKNGR